MASDQARDAPLSRETMISVVERLHRTWSTGDLSVIADLYAPNFTAHFPFGWEFNGRSGVRKAIEDVRRAFSGWTETIQDIIIEGDKAVCRYASTSVHDGLFRGQAPTGERIVVDEISIFRFEGPRIAEQWCVTSRRPGGSAS